jgi:hypothetical protein
MSKKTFKKSEGTSLVSIIGDEVIYTLISGYCDWIFINRNWRKKHQRRDKLFSCGLK